jgi:hypothetical protein
MHFFGRRRVRLRPAYALLYPHVLDNVWLGARRVASLVRRTDPTARQRERAGERLLPDEHFEFRGQPRAGAARSGRSTRSSDGVEQNRLRPTG